MFAAHKRDIERDVDVINSSQAKNIYSKRIGYVKVRVIKKALAKSNRPMSKLFTTENGFILKGGINRGELLFEFGADSMNKLRRAIDKAEDTSEYRIKNGQRELHTSAYRSEVGAIESIRLYGAEDRGDFSIEESMHLLKEQGGYLYVELFDIPKNERDLLTLTNDKRCLLESLISELRKIDGLCVTRSSIQSENNLLVVRLTNSGESVVEFWKSYNSIEQKNIACVIEQKQLQDLLSLLRVHPLVKSVFVSPTLQGMPMPSFAIDHSEDHVIPIPASNIDYPKVAVIDGGISDVYNDWKIGEWDLITKLSRNEVHGTFIGGLLVHGKALNPTICTEPDGCLLYDACVFPPVAKMGAYYPTGMDDFLAELEVMVPEIVSKYSIRIFNISLNYTCTRDASQYSVFAKTLDRIAEQSNVVFVVSAGNLQNLRPEWSVDNAGENVAMLNNRKDDIVFAPAESIRNVSVGALNPDYVGITSYTCRGRGSSVALKPDFVHVGGRGVNESLAGRGLYSLNIAGKIYSSAGTSFAAPIVAKTMACVEHSIQGKVSRETLLALMINSTTIPDCFRAKEYKMLLKDLVGYGVPSNSYDILNGDEHSISLVFSGKIRHRKLLSFRFSWPKSLITNGKCRGRVKLSLVSSPYVDYNFGDEMVRENVTAMLRKIDENENKKGVLKSIYNDSPIDDIADHSNLYEWQLLETEQKWNPIKVYEKEFKNISSPAAWCLDVEYQSRTTAVYSQDGVPFTVLLTISDPLEIAPIYNEMRQVIQMAGAQISDIQTAARITQRI